MRSTLTARSGGSLPASTASANLRSFLIVSAGLLALIACLGGPDYELRRARELLLPLKACTRSKSPARRNWQVHSIVPTRPLARDSACNVTERRDRTPLPAAVVHRRIGRVLCR